MFDRDRWILGPLLSTGVSLLRRSLEKPELATLFADPWPESVPRRFGDRFANPLKIVQEDRVGYCFGNSQLGIRSMTQRERETHRSRSLCRQEHKKGQQPR